MATVKAMSPHEVLTSRKKAIPEDVFEVFNELIALKFNGSYAYVGQDSVLAALKKRGYARSTIFEKHWLDVEDIYREKGWKVFYDKPGYCESYEATFKFSKK